MQITVTTLDVVKSPCLQCQSCNAKMKAGLEFYSGDTIFPPEQSGWKLGEQYWGQMLFCNCPECEVGLYALEVSVPSHPIKGKEFINLSDFTAQSSEVKLVQAGSWEWLMERQINVKFDDDADHEYAGRSMPSIDEHLIGLFMESDDLSNTRANAEKQFQLFLPYIKHIQDIKLAVQ